MEVIRSLFEVSKSRLQNPFIGSFLFSWSFWNWKAILILFSFDLGPTLKITEIGKLFKISDFWEWSWNNTFEVFIFLKNGLIVPSILAFFLIWFIPWSSGKLEEMFLIQMEEDRLDNKKGLIGKRKFIDESDADYKKNETLVAENKVLETEISTLKETVNRLYRTQDDEIAKARETEANELSDLKRKNDELQKLYDEIKPTEFKIPKSDPPKQKKTPPDRTIVVGKNNGDQIITNAHKNIILKILGKEMDVAPHEDYKTYLGELIEMVEINSFHTLTSLRAHIIHLANTNDKSDRNYLMGLLTKMPNDDDIE